MSDVWLRALVLILLFAVLLWRAWGDDASAVVVLDSNDKVLYSELVNEITTEPDYDAAMAALK